MSLRRRAVAAAGSRAAAGAVLVGPSAAGAQAYGLYPRMVDPYMQMYIVDHDDGFWNSNDTQMFSIDLPAMRLDANGTVGWAVERCVDEVRVHVDMWATIQPDNSTKMYGKYYLYEGVTCATIDLDGTKSNSTWISLDGQ